MNTSQKLGLRVFNYYLSKRIFLGILILIIAFFVSSAKEVMVLKLLSIFSLITAMMIVNYFIYGLFIISAILTIGAIFISWLKYISCSFSLNENAFSISRGILAKKEVSIPYRQIQNINIEQTFSHKMMGVSKLIILTAGSDNVDKVGESEGVFEIIDSKLALKIREELLRKTNTQKENNSVIQ